MNIQIVNEQNAPIGYVSFDDPYRAPYMRLPDGSADSQHFFNTYMEAAIYSFAPSVMGCDYRVWVYADNVYRVCTDEEAAEASAEFASATSLPPWL